MDHGLSLRVIGSVREIKLIQSMVKWSVNNSYLVPLCYWNLNVISYWFYIYSFKISLTLCMEYIQFLSGYAMYVKKYAKYRNYMHKGDKSLNFPVFIEQIPMSIYWPHFSF